MCGEGKKKGKCSTTPASEQTSNGRGRSYIKPNYHSKANNIGLQITLVHSKTDGRNTHTPTQTRGNMHSQIIMFPYFSTRHFHFPRILVHSRSKTRSSADRKICLNNFGSYKIACTNCCKSQQFCHSNSCNTASNSAKS